MGRGLLIAVGYEVAQMPREVALALRGADYTAPVTPRPSIPPTAAADPVPVEREAAAATASLLDGAAALLEMLGRESVPTLKAGGVGVRELRRLAKTLRRSLGDVALLIELTAAADLLAVSQGEVLPTSGYDQWRAAPPGERLGALVQSWWTLALTPTRSATGNAKAAPALTGERDPAATVLRQGLIVAAAKIPAGRAVVTLDPLVDTLLWASPMTQPDREVARQLMMLAWSEAAAVGIVAANALTTLGRALLTGDGEILQDAAQQLVPSVATTATFQADLTAMVAGTPATDVLDLLGSVADLEARGSAMVWRFSPRTVRRALDAGPRPMNCLSRSPRWPTVSCLSRSPTSA